MSRRNSKRIHLCVWCGAKTEQCNPGCERLKNRVRHADAPVEYCLRGKMCQTWAEFWEEEK